MNYFLDDKINKAEILFPGVACFLIAVCLGSAVHSSNAADNKAKLDSLAIDQKAGVKYVYYSLVFNCMVIFASCVQYICFFVANAFSNFIF